MFMEDYKAETKRTYDTYAEEFEQKFKRYFEDHLIPEADQFLSLLTGKKILDLGSGPGVDAEYFHKKGFDVLCVDISEAMIARCKEKGLPAVVMDMEALDFAGQSFDGVWAYTSLLHIPRERVPAAVQKMLYVLKPQGILALAIKEGDGEGLEAYEKYPGTQRWWTYFNEDELPKLLANNCQLLYRKKYHVGRNIFINYFFKLKTA
jgi:SAM-dependent methyltransferase